MPGPDPNAVWLEENGRKLSVFYENYLWTNNEGNRKARAIAMLRRAARRDWMCHWCGDALPVWRRVDARYCCEGCRKRAARLRRNWRRN